VGFTVTRPGARSFTVAMDGGRAGLVDRPPAGATVHLTMDVDTFVRLGTGRGDAATIVDSGAVRVDGDEALGRAVAVSLNFLF
jgi:hypothetical protein